MPAAPARAATIGCSAGARTNRRCGECGAIMPSSPGTAVCAPPRCRRGRPPIRRLLPMKPLATTWMAMLTDRPQRQRAVTATDCNLVVTAGAGTGKTTLLVDRLVHLLIERDPPLAITQIVALTFTNKAA